MQLASSEEDEAVTDDSNEKVRIDERAALSALDGQRELLCELASIFCENSPVLLPIVELATRLEQAESPRAIAESVSK